METNGLDCDVAIIGGGPAGSTTAALLKKYNPDLDVRVFEREVFPREHIGESLLPPLNTILEEMGCWDRVEAAGFPIKIGATYRWGKTPELWNFDFLPVGEFMEEPRPAKLAGQRRSTAFQVDRSIYDTILLDRAAELGATVEQGTGVKAVRRAGDRIEGLVLSDGQTVTATHYVDASGNAGVLRKILGIECDYHPALQNIAIWDYWQNADWAVKIGVGGTRIQVRSLPYGWIWFIPMGPTRTSVGLVVPADYYKGQKLRPEELYERALSEEAEVASLLSSAGREGRLQSTKDWSFTAQESVGPNWFLVGECAGFADPILSAGVTMAQISAQQLAYTINEIEHGGNAEWLREEFANRQRQRIMTHIKFGDYWYTANSQFKELKEFTTTLADACGLNLEPQEAWDWIARGGFINEDVWIGIGGFTLDSLKDSTPFLADLEYQSPVEECNTFRLNLRGATLKDRASYLDGRVELTKSYVRKGKVLPVRGPFQLLIEVLENEYRFPFIVRTVSQIAEQRKHDEEFLTNVISQMTVALEAMVSDGWVKAGFDPKIPLAGKFERFTGFEWNTTQGGP